MGLLKDFAEFRASRNHGSVIVNGFSVFSPGTATVSRESALTLSAYYRCITLISNTIASFPLYLYKGNEFVENDLSLMMNLKPTGTMTRNVFIRKIIQDILEYGNAFAKINRKGTKVTGLKYIRPDFVLIKYDEASDRVSYLIRSKGNEFDEADAEDILHFKNEITEWGLKGLSVLDSACRALGIAVDSDKASQNFFTGGNLNGVLTYNQKLTEEQKGDIKTAYTELMSKGDSQLLVIGNNASYTPIVRSARDSQLLESREFQIEEISRFFGIPVGLICPGKTSYASEAQAMLEYLTLCIMPRLDSLEQELNDKLILSDERKEGYRFQFDSDTLLRLDKSSQANYLATLISHGVIGINEARQSIGYEPIDGGDDVRVPLNMSDLNQTMTLTQYDNAKGQGNTQPQE